jgi:hypothetical protein
VGGWVDGWEWSIMGKLSMEASLCMA